MKSLLITTLFILTSIAAAKPEYKFIGSLQSTNYSNVSRYTNFKLDKDLTVPRFSVGLTEQLTDTFGLDLMGSATLLADFTAETNVLATVSEGLRVKGGVHLTRNSSIAARNGDVRLSPGGGFQVGAEYDIDDIMFVDLRLSRTRFNYIQNNDAFNFAANEIEANAVGVGLGFTF